MYEPVVIAKFTNLLNHFKKSALSLWAELGVLGLVVCQESKIVKGCLGQELSGNSSIPSLVKKGCPFSEVARATIDEE